MAEELTPLQQPVTPQQQASQEASNFDADYSDYQEQEAQRSFTERMKLEFAPQATDQQQQKLGAVEQVEDDAQQSGDNTIQRPGMVRRAVTDIGKGVTQAPRSVARGVTEGFREIFGIGTDINRALNMPVMQVFDKNGKFDLEFFATQKAADDNFGGEMKGPEAIIPTVDKPAAASVTGDAIEALSQFFVGLKGVDKVVKASKALKAVELASTATTGGKIATAAVKGAVADMAAFDEQQQRLSNLVESVPELQNPVSEFLKADPNDSFAVAKLKQGIEGTGLGLAAEALVPAIQATSKMVRARKSLGRAEKDVGNGVEFDITPEDAAGVGVEAKQFSGPLGDAEDARLIIPVEKQSLKEGKLAQAMKETEGGKAVKDTPLQKNAFRFNYARIEGPDDIKTMMNEMQNSPQLMASINDARRGVRDERATLTAATDIDGFNELMERRTGGAFNAEQIVAARTLYYDVTEKLMESAQLAARAEASDIDQFNFRKMVAVHHAVQKEMMGVRAEAGRALQAWKIPVGNTPAEGVRDLEQILNEFGGPDASKLLARKVASLGNRITTSQLNKITEKGAFARSIDAVSEVWTLGLLTNPQTHVVNLQSNMLTGLTLGAERAIMALGKDAPVSMREAAAYFHGWMSSQKEAFANAAQAFRSGETGMGVGKVELPRVRATSREVLDAQGPFAPLGYAADWWGRVVGVAGNALAAGDEYSKTVLYRAQLKALATREAMAKGLDGDELRKYVAKASETPSSEMRADALEFAKYGTFTKELGKTGQAVQRAISNMPMLRFIVPFVRTPANIFKFTYERTPLAPLSKAVRDDITAGGMRKSRAMARMGMGTSVMALGSDWALQGYITGAGPADPQTRAALRRTGWQPYSMKVGDAYYSYARMEPIATWLGLSADMAEILSNYEAYDVHAQDEVDHLITAAAMAASQQVVGKTFLSGMADLTEMFADPKRYGPEYLKRYAGSIVPAGVAAIERAVDPATEQVFGMLDAIKARIPGMSDQVPDRLNIWGEKIKTFYPSKDSLVGATAERVASVFNPIYYSAAKDEPVDKFLLRNGFSIDMPDKIQTFDGIRIDLKQYPKIYQRLVELRGKDAAPMNYGGLTMKEYFNELVDEATPQSATFFSTFTDSDEQQQFISQVVRDYQEEAKRMLREEFPVIEQTIMEESGKRAQTNQNRGNDIPITRKQLP